MPMGIPTLAVSLPIEFRATPSNQGSGAAAPSPPAPAHSEEALAQKEEECNTPAAAMEAASDDAWTLTVFANPQVLSLLGAGWTYREILRVNTLSSRRVKLSVSPQDTVLAIKRRLEDQEGVPVEDQELRRVNADGVTETVMRDEQTLRSTGAHSGDRVLGERQGRRRVALLRGHQQRRLPHGELCRLGGPHADRGQQRRRGGGRQLLVGG